MKKTLLVLCVFISSLQLYSQEFSNLSFGSDSTLDIVSWNIEWFPKNGQTTINNVKGIIKAMDAEVIAIQEIDNKNSFQQLLNELDDYSGYYLNGDYQSLAYIYKTSEIKIIDNYEIYTSDWREFPRSPLVLEVLYRNKKYILINNHLKCCGDEEMNPYDDWDEETRRYDASNMLDEYIEQYFPNERVLLLGDLNDELTDRPVDNVFTAFLNDENHYLFADMEIAEGSSSGWSYPNWPSHLDHILITNELFETYNSPFSSCESIKLEEHFYGGYNEYDQKVSDHRPVGIKLKTNDETGLEETEAPFLLSNYPNPFTHQTTISFAPAPPNTKIEIYNINGQIIDKYSISTGQSSFVWNRKSDAEGVYYIKLKVKNKTMAVKKMVLME